LTNANLKKKILIFGGSSTLGTNIFYYLKEKYKIILNVNESKIFSSKASYSKISEADFDSKSLILKKIKKINPDIVINCIANTDLDYCEKYPSKTIIANEIIPTIISETCKKLSIQFIHISTDHLYDGRDRLKKKEIFKVKPINTYAKQKYFAEKNIINNNNRSLIIRTNFFGYSNKKKQFLDFILENAKYKRKIYLYKDYFFTPISTKYFSKYIDLLIKKRVKGIVNIVSSEIISKYEFGIKIFDILNLDKKLIEKKPIKEGNFYAKRCKNLSLSNDKLKKIINVEIPSLDKQLKNFFIEKKIIEKKLFSKIPYGKHSVNSKDIVSVSKVLKSGSLTQGNLIMETENKISDYVGSKYAVLTSSATAGLHITYKALGLNYTNSLITSPITFVSTANAGAYCNSNIIFCDINIDTVSISPSLLAEQLKKSKIKIVSPVHMGGLAANMKEIFKMTQNKNLHIVEDASHALGASYSCGFKVGSCKYSTASIFSFHPVKIIASGEGGVVTTNDKNLYEKLLMLRSHGITSSKKMLNKNFAYSSGTKNLWYYEMQDLGFHYRQTEIHAALLNSQLDRIDKFIKKRREICEVYDKFFDNHDFITPLQKEYRNNSSNHLYIVKINFKKLGITRNEFMLRLRKKNIITQVHYIPLPLHPYYKNNGYSMKGFDNSQNYYNECLSLPIYFDLNKEKQSYVINSIQELIN